MSAQPKYNPDDYINKKFGRLTVTGPEVRRIKNDKGHLERCVYCNCDCGKKEVIIPISVLFNENKRFIISCGCAREEAKAKFSQGRRDGTLKTKPHPIHGDSMSGAPYYPLFHIWVGMKRRCNNPNDKSYPEYGGRGIKVCPEWEHEYLNFKNWALNNGYIVGLSIDRIDNNKGYSPDNCRWASDFMQANNKSNNRYITVNGETHTYSEWARYYNVELYHGLDYTMGNQLTPYEEVIQKFRDEGRPHRPFIIVNELQYQKGCEELKNKEKRNNE